jgi:electron transfer flavoprotein beta subunit
MKILVPLKRVPDYEAKIKIKSDGSGIETDGIKWIVNPFDEIAVEEAIKLKEAGVASEVVVLTVGPEDAVTQLRYALAMGADSSILVKHDGEVDSDLASRAIEAVCRKAGDDEYGLILMGKQAIDSDASQTPVLLATRLGWPQACFASKVEIADGKATVTREVDGGLETIRVSTPCVISADLRLNEPRYASLPGIMKAKKKPLEEIELGSLGIDSGTRVKVLKMTSPSKREAGRKVEGVSELVEALQNEAKVL